MIVCDRFWSFDDRLWSKVEREKKKNIQTTNENQLSIKNQALIDQELATGKLYWCALLV